MTIQNDPVQVLEIIGSPPELRAILIRAKISVFGISVFWPSVFHPEFYAHGFISCSFSYWLSSLNLAQRCSLVVGRFWLIMLLLLPECYQALNKHTPIRACMLIHTTPQLTVFYGYFFVYLILTASHYHGLV